MQDARYLRDQATLCLEIARLVSLRRIAERLRLDAAQYFKRAEELDNETELSASPPGSEAAAKHRRLQGGDAV